MFKRLALATTCLALLLPQTACSPYRSARPATAYGYPAWPAAPVYGYGYGGYPSPQPEPAPSSDNRPSLGTLLLLGAAVGAVALGSNSGSSSGHSDDQSWQYGEPKKPAGSWWESASPEVQETSPDTSIGCAWGNTSDGTCQ